MIDYWATWSAPAKADMATLKELSHKYGRSLAILGVNLDNNERDVNAYLAENPLPWPQMFEAGGLDSRPANILGILTVPTIILVDADGKVVRRSIATPTWNPRSRNSCDSRLLEKCATGFASAALPATSRHWQSQWHANSSENTISTA